MTVMLVVLVIVMCIIQNCFAQQNQAITCENTNCLEQEAALSSSSTILKLIGMSDFTKQTDGRIEFSSEMNITNTKSNCPSFADGNELTQLQLLDFLTASSRYDKFLRPQIMKNGKPSNQPLTVFVRLKIDVLQSSAVTSPELQAYGMLQFRYTDARLAYGNITTKFALNIMGENLDKLIWTPSVYFTNEQQDNLLKTSLQARLTSISANGEVILWYELTTGLNCQMNLQKFPFDKQFCLTIVENWEYNASELQLEWETTDALTVHPKSGLMDFILDAYNYNQATLNTNAVQRNTKNTYSVLKFTICLSRQSGYYILQYFIPSIMLVTVSWVSFWLQPDQTPARTTLGTSTMLSFITLSSSLEKNLPKVNYIKLSEIWFFACIAFIFFSLIEFAFVNTIWRRKHNVALKNINCKQILKHTLTPQNNRQVPKKLRKVQSICSVLSESERVSYMGTSNLDIGELKRQNSSYSSSISVDDTHAPFQFRIDNASRGSNTESNLLQEETERNKTWSSMTPHDVSLWIDRKARFALPLTFLLFNAIFWTIVYIGS